VDFKCHVATKDLSWVDNVRQRMLGVPERAYATYALTRSLIQREVPGCFIECGVFAGVHPAIMWQAMSCLGVKDRLIYLYDSFEGIPHAGSNDTDDIAGELFRYGRDGKLESTGISSCSVEQVLQHMDEWGVDTSHMIFQKGWVENTVPTTAGNIGEIAMLRLDVDLYSATKVCLEHLFPLISKDGYLVVDDMNLAGCRKAVDEIVGRELIPIDTYGAAYMRV